MIPLSVPSIKGNEWQYVKECLDTEWVSSAGKYVELFENQFSEYLKINHSVAMVNGTATLHLALKILDIKPNDEVIIPTITFIAPVNTIKYVGAEPVFMDCDEYYNLDINKTIDFITNETIFKNGYSVNKSTKKIIKAIIPVHIFGNPVDIKPLIEICKEKNIKVIEDATESLGSFYSEEYYNKKFTGTIGDIGCFSFNGNKIITTGGGGMFVTNNKNYAEKARYLSTQAKDDGVRYIHNEIGYNYRLTNVQSAIGVAQLEQLQNYIEIKKINFNLYKKEVNNIIGLKITETPDYGESNYWFYCLQIDKNNYSMDKDDLMKYLNQNGIQSRPVWYLSLIHI